MKRLTDVKIKTTAQVEDLLSDGNLRERMLALGFTKGALIMIVCEVIFLWCFRYVILK